MVEHIVNLMSLPVNWFKQSVNSLFYFFLTCIRMDGQKNPFYVHSYQAKTFGTDKNKLFPVKMSNKRLYGWHTMAPCTVSATIVLLRR